MKKIIKQWKHIFIYKILKKEKPVSRSNIWVAIEHSGWNAYEAYCNLLKMKKQGFITNYTEVNRKNINEFKQALVKSMLNDENECRGGKILSEEAFLSWFFTERQKKAIEQIRNGTLTNRVLSDFLTIDLPEVVEDKNINISSIIRTTRSSVSEGTIFLLFEGKLPELEMLQRIKPRYVICAPRYKNLVEEAGFFYVVKKNLSAYIYELSRIWHSNRNIKTVEITGTVGKTTTTEMIKNVVGNALSMYAITGNQNTSNQVAGFVYRLNDGHEVYVQETAGSTPGQLERSSKVLTPNFFVITNIGHGHIGNYGGSREFLLHEKLAIDRHAAKNAIGVVNMDDELLRASSYSHEIKWFSLYNAEADFYAKNIIEKNGIISFVVVEKNNMETEITIGVTGKHNVYNALSAFAIGVLLGIERKKISRDLMNFKTSGVRQHFAQYGGRTWYFDCYSITEESVASHIKALSTLRSDLKNGRRILVLGDIIQPLGDKAEEVHRRVGDLIVNSGCIDEVFMYGKDTKYTYEVVKCSNIKCRHTDNFETIKGWVKQSTNENDVVGFKANHFSRFEWIIDDLCGTDYFFVDLESQNDIKKHYEGINYKINREYGVGILSSSINIREVIIPESIENCEVRLVGRYGFANNKVIEKIKFPDSLNCIGNGAFENCTSLRQVDFGRNLKYIGKSAFKGCSKLEIIDLSKTQIGTIECNAFAECNNLKKLVLPKTRRWISESAFDSMIEIVESF